MATLTDIAVLVGGRLSGDGKTVITGVSGIREAKQGDITFLANTRYASLVAETKASAIIIADSTDLPHAIPAVIVKNPDLAFATVVEHFAPEAVEIPVGVHPSAVVSPGATLGKKVAVGACAVVEPGASIGDETVLYPHVYIGHNARVGRRCVIYPCAVLRERVEVGDNVIVHAGAVVGSDGFGFANARDGAQKIPQMGTVILQDDVEIGANTTIDRARFDKTLLGKGVKVDNLVQIGHNVAIGDHTLIAAQAGIAGSAKVGKNILIGGQAGVAGHIELGDQVMVAGQAGVTKNVKPGSAVSGTPAAPHHRTKREWALTRKLPEMHMELLRLRTLTADLEERIRELEKTTKDHP